MFLGGPLASKTARTALSARIVATSVCQGAATWGQLLSSIEAIPAFTLSLREPPRAESTHLVGTTVELDLFSDNFGIDEGEGESEGGGETESRTSITEPVPVAPPAGQAHGAGKAPTRAHETSPQSPVGGIQDHGAPSGVGWVATAPQGSSSGVRANECIG